MIAALNTWLGLTEEIALEPDLRICDAHHHLWHLSTSPGYAYLLDDYLRDALTGHNIASSVYVECGSMYRKDGPPELRSLGETEFVEAEAERQAEFAMPAIPTAIIGHANLTLGSRLPRVLEAHCAVSPDRFRGIRHSCPWDADRTIKGHPNGPPPGLMLNPAFQQGVECLGRYDLVFDAWLYHPQLSELAQLARMVPEVTIVLNHVGGPLGIGRYAANREEVIEAWKTGIKAVAECPNVAVKLGGLGMANCGLGLHLRKTPIGSKELAETLAPFLLFVIEQFTPKRCMFESNFPVDRTSYGYCILWNSYKRMTKNFSKSERSSLFHDTAASVYRLSETNRRASA